MFVKIIGSDKMIYTVDTDSIDHFVLTMRCSCDSSNANDWWYGLMIDLVDGNILFPVFKTQEMSYKVYDELIRLKNYDKPDMTIIGDIKGE